MWPLTPNNPVHPPKDRQNMQNAISIAKNQSTINHKTTYNLSQNSKSNNLAPLSPVRSSLINNNMMDQQNQR